MNNHFNLRRFGQLFRKHTVENVGRYVLSTGVLIGVMTLLMGFIAYLSYLPFVPRLQEVFFMLFLLGAGFIFTSSIFSHLGNKTEAIFALSLPASQIEKYLVGWLYSFILFLIVFTGSFYAVILLVTSFDDWHGQEKEILNVFSTEQGALEVYVYYGFVHAVAIWGAIFFNKTHFIKTAFAFFIVLGVLTTLNFQVVQGLLRQDLGTAVPYGEVSFKVEGELYELDLPKKQQLLFAFVPIGLAFLFWTTAYIRIKEKQI